MRMAKRTGLPTDYKCDTKVLKKSDRDKLDAKACPDCSKVHCTSLSHTLRDVAPQRRDKPQFVLRCSGSIFTFCSCLA